MWEDSHWTTFICVAHCLQNAVVERHCKQKLLAMYCRLVGHFKHSALATEGLLKAENIQVQETTLCCTGSGNKVE